MSLACTPSSLTTFPTTSLQLLLSIWTQYSGLHISSPFSPTIWPYQRINVTSRCLIFFQNFMLIDISTTIPSRLWTSIKLLKWRRGGLGGAIGPTVCLVHHAFVCMPCTLKRNLHLDPRASYCMDTPMSSMLTTARSWSYWWPPGCLTLVLHTHAACTAYNPLHIQLLICFANAPLNSTSWAMPFQLPYPHQLFVLMISQLLITYSYQIAQQKHPITTSQQHQLSNAILLATSVVHTHDTPTACNPLHMQLWIAPLIHAITTICALGCAS